ncbi:MAG TPA: hypothetical protein VLE70_19075 [Anaerolineae bacterium]|jgi:hypothetical protein|nr:hypothetical protein [Anaerolineae bacterium]
MELSVILDLVTAGAVILGILFGLLQLRHYHLSQERDATLTLLNSFQTVEFFQGIWIIQGLPDGLTKDEIEDRVGEETRTVYLVMGAWESIGILVYNHEIPIELVENAHGDSILISWQKLKDHVTDVRADLQRETLFEWFQWLAERMIEREQVNPPRPAYFAHRDWRP